VSATLRTAGGVALLVAISVAVSAPPSGRGSSIRSADAARGGVPPALAAAESSAEDVVDYALSGDRASVIASADALKAGVRGAAAAALADVGVPAATVGRLRERADRLAGLARAGSYLRIALAANAVSELMPGLYARFEPRVPIAILTLDYLDREAQLRSLAHQTAKAELAVKQLRPSWAAVRAKIVAAGGAKEAAAFERHVAAMTRLAPRAGKLLEAEAEHGLALVDELEQDFAR
jgi:hypothetical protein